MSEKIIKLYSENIDQRKLKRVIDVLKGGGLIIYPTDTVYGLGCDVYNFKAMQKLAKLKGQKLEKANFSFVCHDMGSMSKYIKPIDNYVFRIIKKALPGPFTFIFRASSDLPKYYKNKREVGIRIPDNNIPREIVRNLGSPIASTSVYDDNKIVEYTTYIEDIYQNFKDKVDLIIEGENVGNIPSTVVSTVDGNFKIMRQGQGNFSDLL